MDFRSLDDILECERTPRIYRKTRRDRMEELQNGTELHLTERQVKERLKLKDQPEDVRTISLPGKNFGLFYRVSSETICSLCETLALGFVSFC